MYNKKMAATLAAALSVSVCAANSSAFVFAEEMGTTDASVTEFQSPTKASQAKIRYWVKSANLDEEKTDADLKAIAEAGFSCVEVIDKGGSTEDMSVYGWRTEEWQKASELIVEVAAKYGLSVDFTVGPTWPAAIPTLDKDDEAASQHLVYGVSNLTAEQFTDGVYNGEIPAAPESDCAQTLIAVVSGKLTGGTHKKEGTYYAPPGGTETNVEFNVNELDEDSLTVLEAGEDGSVAFTLPEGDRAEDYVLFAFYSEGTGQTVSGSTATDAVCIDHYSLSGTNALLNYWEENILSDTLSAYFAENGGDLFEDSLELDYNTIPWTSGLLGLFSEARGYDLTKYLPMIINRFYTATNTSNGEETEEDLFTCYGFADDSEQKIVNDYNELLDTLYQENHLKVINAWAEEHGLNYRVQAYSGYDTTHYDTCEAASMVGTIEGESLAFMESHDGVDSFRILSGGAHVAGKQLVSDELGAVFFGTYHMTFESLAELINKNVAGGANQFVLHGYPSSSETEEENWPGYHPFGFIFGEPWDDRQPVWDDMTLMTDYLARTQEIMQSGAAKLDVAVYRDVKTVKTKYFDSEVLNENGYSYEYLSADVLQEETMKAVDGVLNPDSAAYKALVLYNDTELSTETAERLNEYADNGLAIVIVGGVPARTSYFADSDEDLIAALEQLTEKENVYVIDSEDSLVETLSSAGVSASASYESAAPVKTLHRKDTAADYYWMYNDSEEEVTLTVSFEGNGVPYQMNLWDGSVYAIADYSSSENGITTTITIPAKDTLVVALSEEELSQQSVPAGAKGDEVDLSGNVWTIEAVSYTAVEENSPETQLTPVETSVTGLLPWSETEDLEIVSGTASYQTTLQLEEPVEYAKLNLETYDGTMAITKVLINGTEAGKIDQISKSLDISGLLQEGENTIEICIATTLANAANGEVSDEYGMEKAVIVPYEALQINRLPGKQKSNRAD